MKESFLKSVVTLKKNGPNQEVLASFELLFPKSRNVEWSCEAELFEAIFSEEDCEKIARFDQLGNLFELRTNNSPESLPQHIAEKIKKHGTIMNVIHISNRLFGESFELIIKDSWMVRHLFITDDKGNVITHRNFDNLT